MYTVQASSKFITAIQNNRAYVFELKVLDDITSKLQRQSFRSEEVPGLKPLKLPFSLQDHPRAEMQLLLADWTTKMAN